MLNRSVLRPWALWVIGGVLFAWGLSIAWWMVIEPIGTSDEVYELVIPEGTAAAVEAGEEPPFIPNSLSLGRSRVMMVYNEDVVEHQVGAWTVPPGGAAEIQATDGGDQITCTIHPAGAIGVAFEERPAFTSTFQSALILGIPLGIIFGLAGVVGSRITMDDEPPA